MAEITRELLNKVVLELAEMREKCAPLIEELTTQRNGADQDLKYYKGLVERAEDKVREFAMEYVQQTGDLEPHPSLTFRRTTKLMYEKEPIIHDLLTTELMELATHEQFDHLIDEDEMYKILSSGKRSILLSPLI